MHKHRRIIVPLLSGVIIGIVGFSVNSVAKRYAKVDPNSQKRQTVTYVPEIVSCVKKIRVVKAEIANAGTPEASLVVSLENNSDVGIIAIQIESANEREAFETVHRGSFEDDQTPKVVIKPHEVDAITTPLSSVFAGVPLRIGGAMYADGTEEGCDRGLKTMHGLRDNDKAKKRETLK